jgi:hypothetical protein
MITNIGKTDRLIRLLLAPALLSFGLLYFGGSDIGITLALIAAFLTFSALFGYCAFYCVLGINTNCRS